MRAMIRELKSILTEQGKKEDDPYYQDLVRYGENIKPGLKRFLQFFRMAQKAENKSLKKMFRRMNRRYCEVHGIEISDEVRVGGGLYLGHPYNITVNRNAVIGRNVNIHKGVTIGQENRGGRKGSPVIGNEVWIGVNATIVGKITIGDDVLIAPNSYVNCDVPSHSVVFGNPCVIRHRENATEGYINRKAA